MGVSRSFVVDHHGILLLLETLLFFFCGNMDLSFQTFLHDAARTLRETSLVVQYNLIILY